MSFEEYIKELKEEFKKLKIVKKENVICNWKNKEYKKSFYILINEKGKKICTFEFAEPKTIFELEKILIFLLTKQKCFYIIKLFK